MQGELCNAFFVICGSGTEYKRLEEFKENNKDMHNFLLLNGLPKQEYDEFINELVKADKNGTYLYSKPYYIYKGIKK